jgi:hypothetical protein
MCTRTSPSSNGDRNRLSTSALICSLHQSPRHGVLCAATSTQAGRLGDVDVGWLIVRPWPSPALALWLGADFATRSTRVLQVLAYGGLANGLAAIPFAHIQGAGRARLTATLNVIELPLYLGALFWLTASLGIFGTPWFGRSVSPSTWQRRTSWPGAWAVGAERLWCDMRSWLSWRARCSRESLLLPMDIGGDLWGVALSAGVLVAAGVPGMRMLKAAHSVPLRA